MSVIQFNPNQVRQRMARLESLLEQYEAQHLLLKERIEENRRAWWEAVKEYEVLERQIRKPLAETGTRQG